MTIFEIMNFNREFLHRLQVWGIRLEDANYIGLYEVFDKMAQDGEKVSYIVTVLSQKYGICERKVYSLIKRFKSECKDGAA